MTHLLLIIRLAGERVAIPAEDVESVVEIESLTRIPRVAHHVAGLAALRSRVLTAIDCFASLGLGCSAASGLRDAIVVEVDGYPYALTVESVEDVLEYSGEVRPMRTSLDASWRRVARGVVDVEGDLLLLIDTAALVAGPTAVAA